MIDERRVVPLARLLSALFPDELDAREARMASVVEAEGRGHPGAARHVLPKVIRESPEVRQARQAREARQRALVSLLGNLPLATINLYSRGLLIGWLDERPVLRHEGTTLTTEEGNAVVYEDGRVTRFSRGRFVDERQGGLPPRLRSVTLELAPWAKILGSRHGPSGHRAA